MLQKLQEYIDSEKLFGADDKLLLALSGGVDSVVCLHLLLRLGYKVSAAHVNFKLRGQESDEDMHFVEHICKSLQIPVFIKEIDTKQYIEQHKLSIQEAAREIRYQWFHELKEQYDFSKLITAHHSDDSIETFFINIIRGTGLSGLKGIVSNDIACRPMLCFNREEILHYAKSNHIHWREDSSNAKSDYLRNKLRNNILPQVDKISETWRGNILKLSSEIIELQNILELHYQNNIQKIFDGKSFDVLSIKNLPDGIWLFKKALTGFDYTTGNIEDIIGHIDVQSGAQFLSSTHRLIKDREKFIITSLNSSIDNTVDVEAQWEISHFETSAPFITFEKGVIYIDEDKSGKDYIIRKWQHGDWFIPLGMKGKKKLSDYFIDEKFSIQQKENTFVIVFGSEIAAILGERVDERFKVGAETKRIIKIKRANA